MIECIFIVESSNSQELSNYVMHVASEYNLRRVRCLYQGSRVLRTKMEYCRVPSFAVSFILQDFSRSVCGFGLLGLLYGRQIIHVFVQLVVLFQIFVGWEPRKSLWRRGNERIDIYI